MFTRLESLRGLAACSVVLYHSPFVFGENQVDFVSNSYLFVDFFFVLSGFVMSYAYAERIASGYSFLRFVALRLGRLYPLHLFMLVVWLPFIGVKYYLGSIDYGGQGLYLSSNLETLATNLVLLHAMGISDSLSWNGPSWSIGAEFYIYLLFFLTTRFVDKSNGLIFPIAISLGLYFWLIGKTPGRLDFSFDLGFVRCIAGFYLGVFAFRVRKRIPRLSVTLQTTSELLAATFVIVAVGYADLSEKTIALCIASFLCCVLVFSSQTAGLVGRFLDHGTFRAAGRWSYSIYMTHAIFIIAIANIGEYVLKLDIHARLGWKSVAINFAIFMIILMFSRLTYIHVEDRFRKMTKDWLRRGALPEK